MVKHYREQLAFEACLEYALWAHGDDEEEASKRMLLFSCYMSQQACYCSDDSMTYKNTKSLFCSNPSSKCFHVLVHAIDVHSVHQEMYAASPVFFSGVLVVGAYRAVLRIQLCGSDAHTVCAHARFWRRRIDTQSLFHRFKVSSARRVALRTYYGQGSRPSANCYRAYVRGSTPTLQWVVIQGGCTPPTWHYVASLSEQGEDQRLSTGAGYECLMVDAPSAAPT